MAGTSGVALTGRGNEAKRAGRAVSTLTKEFHTVSLSSSCLLPVGQGTVAEAQVQAMPEVGHPVAFVSTPLLSAAPC